MSASYRLVKVEDLDAGLVAAWRSIQEREPRFESPYFCPEFTRAVGSVRDDVRVVVIENDGRPAGFFPHQRATWGRGSPVGGALSDYHGVIAAPQAEWSVVELMRAARLSVWSFDHLVDPVARFAPYVTASTAASPQIDLASFEPPPDFARKARKLARELGELSFSLHAPGSTALERMFEWKSEQYRHTGLTDAFGVRWTRALLQEAMHVQSAGFAGICSVLRAGDEIVAVHAGMRSRNVLHWWFPTYNAVHSAYSPGILLLLRIAAAAPALGIQRIDLGKGDARYKRSLMTGAAPLREGCVELPSLAATARRLRRLAEARAEWQLPLRALRRLERARRFN
ncbi:MAG TPA: GNAT family N-acetyltransferase [Burkholderiales bacterium]|nr:GNAT family N-acetyltransferase [Burkholderiales bacterium]